MKQPFPTPEETPSRKSRASLEEQEEVTDEDFIKVPTTDKKKGKAKK